MRDSEVTPFPVPNSEGTRAHAPRPSRLGCRVRPGSGRPSALACPVSPPSTSHPPHQPPCSAWELGTRPSLCTGRVFPDGLVALSFTAARPLLRCHLLHHTWPLPGFRCPHSAQHSSRCVLCSLLPLGHRSPLLGCKLSEGRDSGFCAPTAWRLAGAPSVYVA